MADLARLKRSRVSCKSWLQREVNKLQLLLDEKKPDLWAVDQASSELQRRLESCDAAQTAVELELREEELQENLAAAGDFRDSCVSVKEQRSCGCT